MFATVGIALLIAFIYARPQEFFESLKAVPFLYVFFGLTLFGMVIDLRLRHTRPRPAPQLVYVIAFYVWCLFTLAVHNPRQLPEEGLALAISVILYFVIAHGVQSYRAFAGVVSTVLSMVLFVAFVGVHQHLAHKECVQVDESNPNDLSSGTPDGRSCQTEHDCDQGDAEPGASYLCENIGLFGTTSVGRGRVRYRGVLQDPNELALATGVGLPFAFALREQRRGALRTLLLVVAVVLVACCTIFTQSRGGQVVFLAVVGAYFVKRYGMKGVAIGALLAVPLLLFGGRSGGEADQSAIERLECWYEGISMIKGAPLLGVGTGQFTEHHYLTAHNSYLLAASELGIPGMILWSTVVYVSVKTPYLALRRYARVPEAAPARIWGMALLAAWVGLLVGIFFLSFSYHYVLWIYLGLSGAFYSATKRHDPSFSVPMRWRDAALIVGIDVTLIFVLFVYTRLKAP